MADRQMTADECLKWGNSPGANDSRRMHRQQGRRVTTATPEQTQGRSDERALAEAKMRDQCALGKRWIWVVMLFARATLAANCGLQVVNLKLQPAHTAIASATPELGRKSELAFIDPGLIPAIFLCAIQRIVTSLKQ